MNARRIVGLVLVGLVAVGGEIEDMRKRFDVALEARKAKARKAVAKAVKQYEGKLGMLLPIVRERGNLDYVLAVQGEIKRLKTSRTVPRHLEGGEMTELVASQRAAKKGLQRAVDRYRRDAAKLRKGYVEVFEVMERRLVTEGKTEEARLARAEREEVAKTPRVRPMTVVEGYIDRDTILYFGDGYIQWACKQGAAVVGAKGTKAPEPTLVNGQAWYPKWTKHGPILDMQMSDRYHLDFLDGPLAIMAQAERLGSKPIATDKRAISMPDPEPGACWYRIRIMQR